MSARSDTFRRVAVVAALLTVPVLGAAQQGGRGQGPAQSARATAAIDVTGTWVSVVTEEWVSRMVTPKKGYVRGGGIHVTPEGMKLVNAWDSSQGRSGR